MAPLWPSPALTGEENPLFVKGFDTKNPRPAGAGDATDGTAAAGA